METMTIQKAGKLWTYMSALRTQQKSDAIVVCCSYDLRVCDHACDLIASGLSNKLILSGDTGNWTRHIWSKPESQVFFERSIANGINPENIVIEPKATNFGENITFSKILIPQAKTVTFVSKPNSLLRVKLTAEARWPEVSSQVSCPEIEFPSEVSNIVGVFGVINEMVGDIERIQKYPSQGFQVPHLIPDEIIGAWNYLVEQGFTEHLMPNKQLQRIGASYACVDR